MRCRRIVFIAACLCLAGCGAVTPMDRTQSHLLTVRIREEKEKKWRSEIKPGLEYVNAFRKEHSRLPTKEEFNRWADSMRPDVWMLDLVVDAETISRKGGKPGEDFAVGTWISDWYYYYQSWDHKYTHRLETEE